ncbi:adenine methyltransferase [Lactococcus garvieae]|uniref:adenine methyltransferase n=1 Tax=Lactococcus garvieae TaxID=1363 RepID=UPI003853020D
MTYNQTAQHSTAQHSTAQHSTAQHSTAQHSTAQHSTAQHAVDNRLFLLAPKRSGPLERFFRPLTLRAEGQAKRSKDTKRIIKKDKEREKVLL